MTLQGSAAKNNIAFWWDDRGRMKCLSGPRFTLLTEVCRRRASHPKSRSTHHVRPDEIRLLRANALAHDGRIAAREGEISTARLGSTKRPIILRAASQASAEEAIATCRAAGYQFIVGVEPDEPEDFTDLAKVVARDGGVSPKGGMVALHVKEQVRRAPPGRGRIDAPRGALAAKRVAAPRHERIFVLDGALASCGEVDAKKWARAIKEAGGQVGRAAAACGIGGPIAGARAVLARSLDEAQRAARAKIRTGS